MAVTSIWPITGDVGGVIEYAKNPEKTTEKSRAETAALHAIDNVVEYTADELKTEQRMYVSGINCQVDFAKEQFMDTKTRYGKLGGRTCYHGYQSFKAGEVDADTAHKIGVELAKELWGERFEVVVATHLNTGHYHNHFVINSVSFLDGYKYYNFKADYLRMREVSDRLCKEYDLSVIKNPRGKGKHYTEWQAEKQGKPTKRSLFEKTIRADIDEAILASVTEREFMRIMTGKGYTFNIYTKSGDFLAYPSLKPPGAKGAFRFHKLGPGYSLEEIKGRIFRNVRRRVPFSEAEDTHRGKFRYRGSFKKAPKATGLRALYYYYCYKLKIFVKKPASGSNRVPASLFEDIVKLDKRIEETRFLGKHHIETAADLDARALHAKTQIEVLSARRNDLRNAQRRANRQCDHGEAEALRSQIAALTGELRKLRKEVAMCSSIAQRSGLIREGLEEINRKNNHRGKEKNEHEYIWRSSRTGSENVPGGRRGSR